MQLARLQRELQRDLLGVENAIASAIVEAPPLATEERLAIYRHAYRARLTEALDDIYPVLHGLLGDETFAAVAGMFIEAHPSVHRSIRWYGRELADFLAERAPFAEQPILSEVARFEWTLSEVFDAPDSPSLDRATLMGLDPQAWAGLEFRFHPSLRRLRFSWNTVTVWKAVSESQDPPAPESVREPVPWLLWRRDLKNYFRSMDAPEDAALETALGGQSFASVCARLTQYLSEEETPLRAAALVGTWTDSGIIAGIGRAS